MTTAFENFVSNPSLIDDRAVLAELRPRQRVTGWFATDGRVNVWEVAFEPLYGPADARKAREIYAVRQGDSIFTQQATLDDVESTPRSWLWDSGNSILYVQGGGGNPDSEDSFLIVEVLLKFATRADLKFSGYDPRLDLADVPEIAVRGVQFLAGQTIDTTAGSLRLNNADGLFNQLAYDAAFAGSYIRLLLGSTTLDYDDFQPVFIGHMSDASVDPDYLSVSLRPLSDVLTGSLPANTITTERWPGCLDDAVGKPIPLLFGRMEGISPPRVQSKDAQYQITFNGSNYARITDDDQTGLDLYDAFHAWIDVTPKSLSGFGTLVSKYAYPSGCSYGIFHSNGAIRVILSGDGSTLYYAYVVGSGLSVGRRSLIEVSVDCANEIVYVWIDGVQRSITESGSIPATLFDTTANFCINASSAGYSTTGLILHELIIENQHAASSGKPNSEDAIVLHIGGDGAPFGLLDRSKFHNHLTAQSGLDETAIVNVGGSNPIAYQLSFNDGVSNELMGCARNDLANNLRDGFVVEVEVVCDGAADAYCAGVGAMGGSNNQFNCWVNDGNGRPYLYLSGDGTYIYNDPNSCRFQAALDIGDNEIHTIKFVYIGGASPQAGIAVDGAFLTTNPYSGAVPSQLYDSTCDFLSAAVNTIASPTFQSKLKVRRISVSSTPSGQLNVDPIHNIIHQWQPDPATIFEDDSSNLYVPDEIGGAHLQLINADAGNCEYASGGDRYVVADPLVQTIGGIDRVYYTSGEREVDLEEGVDYSVDLEECEITMINPDVGSILVDARGAAISDIPCGIAGRSGSEMANKASDAILFLLSGALGLDDDYVDLDSASTARVGDKEVAFYLSSTTTISQLLYQLCLSGCLLDLVVDEKIRLRRWAPNVVGMLSLVGEELEDFSQPLSSEKLCSSVQVEYVGGIAEAIVVEAADVHDSTAIKTLSTHLVGASDAKLLADRLALLCARPPLPVEALVPNLRLAVSRPGDALLVSRDPAVGPSGSLAAYPLAAVRLQQLAASGAVRLVADDWSGALRNTAVLVADGYSDYASADNTERARGAFVKTSTKAQKDGQCTF